MVNRVSTKFEFGEQGNGLRQVIENLDSAEDRAKAVADALNAMADEARADFDRMKSATEAVSSALGPEFASDLDRGEAAVADLVERLRRLGLTYEEIEANADQLATAAKRLDDVRLDAARSGLDQTADSTRRAKGEVDDITDSARGANSALANMVGNSAQDVGELAGVSGSAGVALGQMAEYASDARLAGEGLGSSLRSMAMVAGPIAAVAIGVELLGRYLNRGKEEAEALKEATDEVTNSLIQAQDAGEDLGDTLDDIAQGRADAALAELGDKVDDLIPAFDRLGISYQDVVRGFRSGEGPLVDALTRYRELREETENYRDLAGDTAGIRNYAEAHGLNADRLLDEWNALRSVNSALGDNQQLSVAAIGNAQAVTAWRARSIEAIEEETAAIGRSRDPLSLYHDMVDLSASALRDMTAAQEGATEAQNRGIDTLTELRDRIDGTRTAQRQLADQTYALHDAEYALEQAVESATTALQSEDLSLRGARSELQQVATAADRVAQGQVTMRGMTMESKGAIDVWMESMLGTARTLDGPMREAVLAHVTAVTGIPRHILTEFLVETDPERLRQLEADFNFTARERFVRFSPTGGMNNYAEGTTYHPGGLARINERGGEIVELPTGSKVMTAAASAAYLDSRGGPAALAGGGVNISVKVDARGAPNPTEVGRKTAEALAAWVRNGGDLRWLRNGLGLAG